MAEKSCEDKTESTVSTKLSTDQLICKSPPSLFISTKTEDGSAKKIKKDSEIPITLYLGILQILFGLLMAVFGVLVLVHDSSLSQIGGGLWGGCLAAITGTLGVMSSARECCPLKSGLRRAAHTVFLALSLVSLALAHLVLVVACIGLSRDTHRDEYVDGEKSEDKITSSEQSPLLANSGLLLVSACECACAALSAYYASRSVCPCFRPSARRLGTPEDVERCATNSDTLVSSWLGKQGMAHAQGMLNRHAVGMGVGQQVFVVATSNGKEMTKMMAPIFTVPPPPSMMPPSVLGYPLIPAPLGTTPPPIIHRSQHRNKVHRKRKRFPSDRQLQRLALHQEKLKKKKKRTREKKKVLTAEDVARTYTGLDRVIAEEFIEICDSTRTSSDFTGCTNSDTLSY